MDLSFEQNKTNDYIEIHSELDFFCVELLEKYVISSYSLEKHKKFIRYLKNDSVIMRLDYFIDSINDILITYHRNKDLSDFQTFTKLEQLNFDTFFIDGWLRLLLEYVDYIKTIEYSEENTKDIRFKSNKYNMCLTSSSLVKPFENEDVSLFLKIRNDVVLSKTKSANKRH